MKIQDMQFTEIGVLLVSKSRCWWTTTNVENE